MDLSALLTYLNLLPTLTNLVYSVVQEIENAFGAAGLSSNQKFMAAEAKINIILQTVVADAAVLVNVTKIVPALINSTVAAFNAAGLFKKAAASA